VAVAATYKGYRYPIVVIGHAVWLYHRFALSLREGIVKLVCCLVAAKIGGRDRCIVVVQGTPLPGRDHRPLRVALTPVPTELS